MESEVIRRAQQGHQQSFQQIVEFYSPLIWRASYVFLKNYYAVEDVLQDVWIEVWKSLPKFQTDRSFRPWLLAIVGHRCRMWIRSSASPTISLEQANAEVADLSSLHNTEVQVMRNETDDEVRQALQILSSDHRIIIELHYFAELNLPEIATILNIPVGTVKSRLHRALQQLQPGLIHIQTTTFTGGHEK